MHSRGHAIAANLVLCVSTVGAVLLAGEGALRLAGFRPERHRVRIRMTTAPDIRMRPGSLVLDGYPSNPRGYFDIDLRDPATRTRYQQAGVRRLELSDDGFPFAVEFRYNAAGYRDREFGPRRPGVRRLVVMGDSFTEGQGVREPDSYVRVLEARLNASGEAWEAFNLGYRGHDFPELYGQFQEAMRLDPDVVLFGMVLNDGERVAAFDKQWPAMNDWIMVRRPPGADSPLRLLAFIEDRLQTRRISQDATRWYRAMYGPANEEGWQRTRAHLRAMEAETRARKVGLLVALWPLFVGLDAEYPLADVHEKIAQLCARRGIAFRDLLPLYRGRDPARLWVHPADWHPNEIAHRLAADDLAPLVRHLEGARAIFERGAANRAPAAGGVQPSASASLPSVSTAPAGSSSRSK
jgi:lysophospholipase L1-like esterase